MSNTSMFVGTPHHCAGLAQRRGRGQVVVMFALCATVFLLVLGGSLDFAAVIMERGRLQNAADSAALAAAQTLGDGGSCTAATTAATTFLALNGYTQPPATIVVTFLSPPCGSGPQGSPQGAAQIVDVRVSHPYQTSFWGLIGLQSVSLQVDAQASSPARRFDIFLSIDETSSMNDDDIAQLRRAAHLFVQTLNPNGGDPYSPKVAMSVFEGLRYGAAYGDIHGLQTQVALRESLILTNLTNNAPNLYTLIDGPQSGQGCGTLTLPSGQTDQPPMPYAAYPPQIEQNWYQQNQNLTLWPLSEAPGYNPAPPLLSDFACPLKSDHRGVNRTFVGDGITAAFARNVLSPFGPSTTWDAFDYHHRGRDGHKLDGSSDPAPPARRILVVMTDGTSNIVPISPGGTGDCSISVYGCTSGMQRWEIGQSDPTAEPDKTTRKVEDDAAIEAANVAKSGPDGQPGIPGQPGAADDNIEIYTIGFFGDNLSALTAGATPLCPAAVITPDVQTRVNGSRADRVMLAISSSSPGSCDHYFPVAKSAGQQNDQGLPTIFSAIAGRIKRAYLVN